MSSLPTSWLPWDPAEGHLERGGHRVDLVPHPLEHLLVVAIALDRVADLGHERRAQEVRDLDRALEHAGPREAGAIGKQPRGTGADHSGMTGR
jgi:hypothetical protein